MLDDIFYFAVKDKAQCVKSFSSDIHTLLHPVQGIGRNAMMKYQMILSNPFFQQSIIKWCIRNHKPHRLMHNIIMFNLLTILKKLSVI